jgi:hypothetical protein
VELLSRGFLYLLMDIVSTVHRHAAMYQQKFDATKLLFDFRRHISPPPLSLHYKNGTPHKMPQISLFIAYRFSSQPLL